MYTNCYRPLPSVAPGEISSWQMIPHFPNSRETTILPKKDDTHNFARLKIKSHVQSKCRSAMANYCRIASIRNYLTIDSFKHCTWPN